MKKIRKTSPVILAVLCAVGVHTVLFTDAGHRMQGAITESSADISVSDSSLILDGDTISFVIQKDIYQAKEITASLSYNDTSLTLSKPESSFGSIQNQSEEYTQDVIITSESPKDLKKWTVLAVWKITKILPEIHTINLSDVQVKTSEEIINLSTKGTGEF